MKLQKAMQDMNKTPEGVTLLKNVNIHSLEPVTDRDYDSLRSLNIKPLEVK